MTDMAVYQVDRVVSVFLTLKLNNQKFNF